MNDSFSSRIFKLSFALAKDLTSDQLPFSNLKLTLEENINRLNFDISDCCGKYQMADISFNNEVNSSISVLKSKINSYKSIINSRLNNYITKNDESVSIISTINTNINNWNN